MGTTPHSLHIRARTFADRKDILDIEREAFGPLAWTSRELEDHARSYPASVVEDEQGRVIGYMVYELEHDHIHILRLAVHPDHQRNGVGTWMVQQLQRWLCGGGRECILIAVSEYNLSAQLFLRSMGFLVDAVLRDPDGILDAPDDYLFEYSIFATSTRQGQLT